MVDKKSKKKDNLPNEESQIDNACNCENCADSCGSDQFDACDELGSREELQIQLIKQKELFLRTAAEFDNFKKRTERERASLSECVKSQTLKFLLPVFDNIDRAASYESGSEEYVKGIEMIVKQLQELKGNVGLSEIGEMGEGFNPNLHEAVMHIENEEFSENCIAEVLQKGYRIGETVIRPAMVKVAN